MSSARQAPQVVDLYRALLESWGPQQWWPARTQFEVIAGAFLTQNTAWTNVEKALDQLRAAGALSLAGIRNLALSELEPLVRSAGYFRQKALRLKNFVAYVDERHERSLRRMFSTPTDKLRTELLQLNGVGPETADAILLYAGGHPVFVVDAYTRRVFDRHRILPGTAKYEDIRSVVETAFVDAQRRNRLPQILEGGTKAPWRISALDPASAELARAYNEFHALLVTAGKRHCQKAEARCESCPLEPFLNL